LTALRLSDSLAAMTDASRLPPSRRHDPSARDRRLARALRENLRRRKEQSRARQPRAPAPGGERPGDPTAADEPAA
jgi:hypothetical protein